MKHIKYFFITIWKHLMNAIYMIFKMFKTKNKVTFISRQTNKKNIDFNLIIDKLKKEDPNIKVKILNKKLEKNLISIIVYVIHMFEQMYHIATSKVVIIDGYCILISILKHKKSLKVIQIWHALGSFKKFAYSIINKNEGTKLELAKVMKMHENYDYILTSSEFSKQYFKEAFNASEELMKVIPLPRVDFLKSETYKEDAKEKFYDIYNEISPEKHKILYVPTFRKNNEDKLDDIINNINYEKFDLILKTHDGEEIIYTNKDKYISKKTEFTGLELLHVADYVITDYSAIVYEAAVAKKPIYFYNYDYNEYMNNRGLYIDYFKEMPGPISKDINVLLNKIENEPFDYSKLEEFENKYITNEYKNNTDKIVELILK